jgi:hypothetical protein
MTALPLALSLSSTFTKIGAIAAFAALVGIAILSLLVFSQARELKRLREWAGRAPERAADLEQRVSNNAAARLQQQVPGGQAVRPVPRSAPIQAQAAAAGAGPATRVVGAPQVAVVPAGQPLNASGVPVAPTSGTPGVPLPPVPGASPQSPVPGQSPAPGQPPVPARPVAPGQPAAPGAAPLAAPAPGQPPVVAGRRPVPTQPPAGAPIASPPTASAQPVAPSASPPAAPVGTPASVAGAAQSRPVPGAPAGAPAVVDPRPPAPATAAAAAAAAPRAPSPPRVSVPAADQGAQAIPQSPPAQSPPGQPAARRPPAPVAAGAAGRGDTRAPILAEGRRATYTTGRSRRRTAMLIVGGLVVVAAVVVGVVSALGGSSGHKGATSTVTTSATRTTASNPAHSHKVASKPKTPALSPAETNVAVLNATETEGLAHRTANELQQNGYSQAAALNGKPPGSGQVSIVEYANGHQAEAEGVAHSANVTHVQPMEAAVAALANSASVVLIVGADKATQSP